MPGEGAALEPVSTCHSRTRVTCGRNSASARGEEVLDAARLADEVEVAHRRRACGRCNVVRRFVSQSQATACRVASSTMGQQRRRCLLPDRDIYRVINELDPATVEALGERLEFRGSDATFNQMRETYFDQLPLVTAETVLDLGCGTGVEVRALLKREAFGGHVVAIDHSPALIETARRLAEEEQFGERIEYRIGDVHRLDLRDASYDIGSPTRC
jgi:2-polyprenyl-3-methyl-5-hydroxy-6-metoxy-1,4-benzoquinol methylase